MNQFLTSQYWLAPQALTFTLNALGDPQKVAVSVSSGAMVMAYMPGVEGLGFDNAHSYRRWPVSGYASVLKDAVVTTTDAEGEPTDTIYPAIGEKYVYILIPRNAQSGSTALVGFAPCIIDYLGYTEEGVHIGTDQYYYLYIQGIISASVEGGNRTWQQDIVSGTLATEEAYSEGPDIPWYRWNALSQSVSFLKRIVMDAASWFSNLRTSSVQFVGNGTQDKGTLTSVADFGTISDSDTGAVVTTKYLADREEEIEKKYLRKDQDDETDYKLKMQFLEVVKKLTVDELSELNGILQNKDFSDSMTTGKSWGLFPSGRMQLESLEVRSSLKVLELIYNRLSAQESEFVFTESGTIEEITPNEDGTYTCKIERRNDTDFHAFKQGDVLRGVVNDLNSLGGGEYYTAWMWVSDIDTGEPNTITVNIYNDADVPSCQNYLPAKLMRLQRWGNNVEPSEDAYKNPDYKAFIVQNEDGSYRNTRQSCWYISSIEKRIAMLDGVNHPKINNENYTAFFGLPFNFVENTFKGHVMNPLQPYLYVRGAFLQDIHYIDYQGNPVRQERNRGVWKQEVAENDPYVVNSSTYDTCYYNNIKWQCAVPQASTQPPSVGNPDWIKLYDTLSPNYRIIPSAQQILREPDGSTNLDDDTIHCDVVVDDGGDEPRYVYEDEVHIYIGKNQQMPVAESSRTVTIEPSDISVEFYMLNAGSELGEAEFGDAIFAYLTGMVSVPIYERGSNGITPTIDPDTKNWVINGVVTEYTSVGDEGHSPYIGSDGYWYEWDAETEDYKKTTVYAEGNGVIAQYSADCIDWFDVFYEGALWMRTKNRGDAEWGDPFRVVGEKGDGADYVACDFGISASLTNPTDVTVWTDAPSPTTTNKPYQWMRQMRKIWDAEKMMHKNDPAWGGYKYVRLTGEKGPQGAIGPQGPQGPQGIPGASGKPLRGPSQWNAETTYTCGAGNEDFQDIVYLGDKPSEMFLCKVTNKGKNPATTSKNESWDEDHPWTMTEYREFTASKVLFVGRGKIENLDVTNCTIKGTLSEEMLSTQEALDEATQAMCVDIISDGDYGYDASDVSFQAINVKEHGSVYIPIYDRSGNSPILHRNKILLLPRYIDTDLTFMAAGETEYSFRIPKHEVSGTHLTISVAPPPIQFALWSCIKDSQLKQYFHDGYGNLEHLRNLYNMGVLVCADPLMLQDEGRILTGEYYYGTSDASYFHGRFSFNGASSRFIFLMPGQTLHLISTVEEYQGANCLTWYVQNAFDFEPLTCIASTDMPMGRIESFAFNGEVNNMNPSFAENVDRWQDIIVGSHKINPAILNPEDPFDDGLPQLAIGRGSNMPSWYWDI